jgi:hypothetical protein
MTENAPALAPVEPSPLQKKEKRQFTFLPVCSDRSRCGPFHSEPESRDPLQLVGNFHLNSSGDIS